MNSSVINSSRPFNHSSSGSSLQFWEAVIPCIFHRAGFVFELITEIINLVVGYPANTMVMWLVAREKSDSSTSNYFIFSLALIDAWCCAAIAIFHFDFSYYGYTNFYFHVLNFSDGITNGSLLFLTCICLDRYVAVVHPIVFTSIKDKKIRVAISILAWGFVIASAINTLLLTGFQQKMYVGLAVASFTTMVFCNVSIIWNLRKSVLGKEKINPMKKKALRTVQIYLGIIVFHHLPDVVFCLLSYDPDFPEYCTIKVITSSVKLYSSSTLPLLYLSLIKQLP